MHPEFTLYHLLANSAERRPEQIGIVDGERQESYAELACRSARLAGALQENGLRRGDRVAVCLDKSWEAVVSLLAVAQAGGVFVPVSPLLKERQIAHIMGNCGVRLLVADAGKVDGLALPPVAATFVHGEPGQALTWSGATIPLSESMKAGPEMAGTPAIETDLGAIIYTSGSTGLPKGIMLSHRNLVAGAQIVSTYLENSAEDRVLSVLPLNFDYGLNQLTTMLRVGGTLVLQRSLLPGDILRSLRQEAITGLAGVPPVWTLLLQARRGLEREPLQHMRYITNSGGMIPAPHLEELRRLLPGIRIYLMYGLTEAFRSTYLPPEDLDKGPACIGKAIPNTDVWVVNERGEECAPEETGELVHRGPTVALGYWGDEEKTRSAYRPNPFAQPELRQHDTVVYSGDLVWRDQEGFLHFVGRRDELIKTEGYRVSPQEVEDLLCSLPRVREAAAFGVPDAALGQRIVAYVAMEAGAAGDAEALRGLCAERAPHYLVPKEVRLVSELPRGATGKIDRSALKHANAGS